MNIWYQNLDKSPLTPPAFVFPIIWGILYSLIIISVIIYTLKGFDTESKKAFTILAVNIILNLIWTPLFFIFHFIVISFIDIILMILTILPVIYLFYKKSKAASYLLIPYLIWLFIALYLNFEIIVRN